MCVVCLGTFTRWRHGVVGGEYKRVDPLKYRCALCRHNRAAERAGRPLIAELGTGRRKPSRSVYEKDNGLRMCAKCRVVRPEDSFVLPAEHLILSDWCAECRCAHLYRGKKMGSHHVRWRERDQVLALYGSRCGVCGTDESSGRRLHIDHCHETGYIRGLLCVVHNFALGALHDSEQELEALLKYLRESKEAQRRLTTTGSQKPVTVV